ncbi:MAG: DUF5662 family protein [Butyricicoccaceae bacterium]
MRWKEHFKTITNHKIKVMQHCFKVGLYRQGLLHDLSKYSPVEFWAGARYYVGTRSPNEIEREKTGVSSAWLHHKGRNKHHFEYWIDYSAGKDHKMCGMKMPLKYVIEMFCDRVAASKIYRGDQYTDRDPYDYLVRSRSHYIIHPETEALLEQLLLMLKDEGEDATFAYIRKELLGKKK